LIAWEGGGPDPPGVVVAATPQPAAPSQPSPRAPVIAAAPAVGQALLEDPLNAPGAAVAYRCPVASSFLLTAAGPVRAQPFCEPGESPEFRSGFAQLKEQLGAVMAEPAECEHLDAATGDTLQNTTTGLAYYRQATNTPTFTDGQRHWALTGDGLIAWEGGGPDPPGVVVAAPPPPAAERLGEASRPAHTPAPSTSEDMIERGNLVLSSSLTDASDGVWPITSPFATRYTRILYDEGGFKFEVFGSQEFRAVTLSIIRPFSQGSDGFYSAFVDARYKGRYGPAIGVRCVRDRGIQFAAHVDGSAYLYTTKLPGENFSSRVLAVRRDLTPLSDSVNIGIGATPDGKITGYRDNSAVLEALNDDGIKQEQSSGTCLSIAANSEGGAGIFNNFRLYKY